MKNATKHADELKSLFKKLLKEGKPEAKTLAQCTLCHQKAQRGWFSAVTYTITDRSFRSEDTDLSDSPMLLMRKKK